jgi:hypothetical protein
VTLVFSALCARKAHDPNANFTHSNSQVSFATDATPSQKVEMFTAMFLAEFMFFEQDNGMCKFDPATKQCVLTCFQCYFYGCLCPCQIRLGSGGSGGGGS